MMEWTNKKLASQAKEPKGYTPVDHPYISLIDLTIAKTDLILTVEEVMTNIKDRS